MYGQCYKQLKHKIWRPMAVPRHQIQTAQTFLQANSLAPAASSSYTNAWELTPSADMERSSLRVIVKLLFSKLNVQPWTAKSSYEMQRVAFPSSLPERFPRLALLLVKDKTNNVWALLRWRSARKVLIIGWQLTTVGTWHDSDTTD